MHDGEVPETEETASARQRLGWMIRGFTVTQLVGTAARLELADRLRDGPRNCVELAEETEAHAPSLRRLMRALVEIGVLREASPDQFEVTAMGRLLQRDVPGSLRPVAMVYSGPFYNAWGSLLENVMTGQTAFQRVLGAPIFDYFAQHPEIGEAFDHTMTSMSATMAAQVVDAYNFAGISTVVDVGGGQGALLGTLLKANAVLTGVLFDQPSVIEGARVWIAEQGLTDRCRLVAGDFFTAVPEGGDAYLLKWILHDWDDERSSMILRNCRKAMREQDRLLIVEVVLPDRFTDGPVGAVNDIHMLTVTGGRERTAHEYRSLLAATGFHLARIIPTTGTHPVFGSAASIIEGIPVGG
jgi:hypothetical protein